MNTSRMRVLAVSQAIAMLLCMVLRPHAAYASASNGIVVSLGDSYSSGEGNPPFYGQDEVKGFYDSELRKRISDALDEEHPYAFQNDGSKSANTGAARTITEDDDLGLWLALEDYYAHRSTKSWPGQLVVGGTTLSKSRYRDVGRDAQWYFYASTGAVAKNVYETRQDDKDGLSGGVRVQLEAARGDLAGRLDDVAYVTMTIGGNDIGFADIVKEVAARNAFIDRDYLFNAMNASWKKFDGHEPYVDTGKSRLIFVKDEGNGDRKDQILECYRKVGEAFPNAQIVVAGYPTLMNDDRFEEITRLNEGNAFERALALWELHRSRTHEPLFYFSSWEGWFVNQNAREFNRALQNLVDEANEAAKTDRFHFVSVEKAFDGHEAYTGKGSLINGIKVWDSERSSDIDMSYSFHPNKDGIAAYRDAVQKKIEELEDERPLVAYLDDKYADRVDDVQDEQHTTDEAYAAYASKLEEYLDEFGQPDVRAVWNVDEYMCSAEGVCVAELIDFDADGSDELLVVYYDKDVAADVYYTDIDGNEHERDLNDGSAYIAEVWSYADGSLKLAYRQPAQASNGGWAYLSRLAFDDRKSWLRSEDYEGSHYIKLWEFAGQDSSVVHYHEIRDEYTSDMTTWIDGAEESLGIDEWRNDYGAESVTYRLINKESATDKHEGTNDDGSSYHNVYGCIDLTKETMHRLGITTNGGEGNNESGKTDNGTYILSGTVHVHEEDFAGERTDSVVSIVLDEDVPYEYEYKETVQAVAHDVLLATTGSEAFRANRYDEWAQYDGQHITVECDGLQGAYHDASYWNVDTLATGKIWLLNSSSQATFHVEDYYKQIERQSKESVVYATEGDFDDDDSNEAFVVTGSHVNDNHTWTNAEVWFVSSSGMVSKAAGEETFPALLWYKDYEPSLGWWDDREYPSTYYGFFCVESTGGGPTSTSHAYGVRDGKVVEAPFDVEYIGDVHYEENSGKIVGSVSVSLSPRKWQKYGFDFDPDSFSFRTTGSIGDPA